MSARVWAPRSTTELRLERDEAGVDTLLAILPERAVQIGGSGALMLGLCDGARDEESTVAELSRLHPEIGADVLREDLQRLLRGLEELGVVERRAPGRPTPPLGEPRPAPRPVGRAPRPYNLIAELTYRCPLRCPYCSNPVDYAAHREAVDTEAWRRVFFEAAALGVVHVGLTGGEPSLRGDLEQIVDAATEAGLYSHLVTAATPLDPEGLARLAARGLRSVQVSVQDADPARSDRLAGLASFAAKIALCEKTKQLGLPLTLNVVLHRENLDHIDSILELAFRVGADRLELANTQYHGWALRNRAALLPSSAQLEHAAERVAAARARAREGGGPELIFVRPDYFSGRPKPCMGGWGRTTIVVRPTGLVLPCHEAASLPGLEFFGVDEQSLARCWADAPGMNRFRGTDWLPEPCRSCPEKEKDFGGCRCQAFALTGDPTRTDPACDRSLDHAVVVAAREETGEEASGWAPRGQPTRTVRSGID